MKTFLVALTLAATLASAPFASAQQTDEIVAKTHWSYEVLKKLCLESDINACRFDKEHISYSEFLNADFRLRRMPAALVIVQIVFRRARYFDAETARLESSFYGKNNLIGLTSLEAKDALKALLVEYEPEIRQNTNKSYNPDDNWRYINKVLDVENWTSSPL